MQTRRITTIVMVLAVLILVLATSSTVAGPPVEEGTLDMQAPVGTAFTYQGRLTDGGNPANGSYDFEFKLYDASGGGSQVGSVTKDDVTVTDGLFTVELDFGSDVFKGDARYLEIGMRPGSSTGAYTTLLPRQALAPSPYALALPGLWTQQNATSPNVIGGHSTNGVAPGVVGATIGGGGQSGDPNQVTADYGTIGGGKGNEASGERATVGGGGYNSASGNNATVAGGSVNIASGVGTTIGGGNDNTSSNAYATIGGGQSNSVSGRYVTVGGGHGNTASGDYAAIGGGESIRVMGQAATVAGGSHITATNPYAAVGGGQHNVASGDYATVGGGGYNTASGFGAVIAGGGGFDSFWSIELGNIASGEWSTVGGGVNNTASGAWATIGGGQINTVSNQSATVGGGAGNTASEAYATVGGGDNNTASGEHATVGGGNANTSSGMWSTVAGGSGNIANAREATIGGGAANAASGRSATVGGGVLNSASGDYVTIGGGGFNDVSGEYATVPGGSLNTAQGAYSFAAGRRAKAIHEGAFVWADSTDADFASTAANQFAVRANGGALVTGTSIEPMLTVTNLGGNDGLRVNKSGDDGLQIGDGTNFPDYGVYIPPNGVPFTALSVQTANPDGEWALATDDKIRSANVTFSSLTLIAVVDGPDSLTPGDLVAATGLADPLPGTMSPLPRVRLADAKTWPGVIGVVESLMALQPMPGKAGGDGDAPLELHSVSGPAKAGDYVGLTVLGVAHVKADATTDAIVAGQRLTAADRPGYVRALRTRMLEGMVVTEGASVIGIALAPLDKAAGMIPVFVALR